MYCTRSIQYLVVTQGIHKRQTHNECSQEILKIDEYKGSLASYA
jgi:hypothetical protein